MFVTLFMGLFVYYKNPTSTLNKVFFLFSIELSFWEFVKFNTQVALSYDFAFFWKKMEFGWIFMLPTMFYFAAAYAGMDKLFKSRLIQIILFFPMCLNLYSYISSDESGLPYKQFWGWSYNVPQEVYQKDLHNFIISAWMSFVTLSVVVFFFYGFFKTKEKVKRQQAKFILIGVLILLIFGLFDWFPGYRMNWPEVFIFGLMIFSVILGYAIWKYELFAIDPVTASESIVKTMDDALFLVDERWKILTANEAAQDLTSQEESTLEGSNLLDILFGNDAYKKEEFTFKVLGSKQVRDYEIFITIKDKRKIFVSISTSKILSNDRQIRGIVCLGRDISARKESMRKIEQQTSELTRINNLLQGREKRLVELKKEYKELNLHIIK